MLDLPGLHEKVAMLRCVGAASTRGFRGCHGPMRCAGVRCRSASPDRLRRDPGADLGKRHSLGVHSHHVTRDGQALRGQGSRSPAGAGRDGTAGSVRVPPSRYPRLLTAAAEFSSTQGNPGANISVAVCRSTPPRRLADRGGPREQAAPLGSRPYVPRLRLGRWVLTPRPVAADRHATKSSLRCAIRQPSVQTGRSTAGASGGSW